MAAAILSLLGDTLRKPDGSTVTTDEAVKSKKVLGLYFSAHWCPPCRGFTPVLSQKYTALKKADTDFELVFVSSDKTEDAFNDYHKEMTFLALPYADRDAKAKLSKKFKVAGIPSLVFVDMETGKLITDEGREGISSDKFIEDFPYAKKPVDVLAELGATLRKPDGSTVATSEALNKDVLGLYFSAHWCPPCRGFTPVLSEKYTALKEAGKSFELVFISSDRDEGQFDEYHKEMTFLALPFAEREAKATLSKHFGVNGIPSLCFYDVKAKKIITTEGRGGISSATFKEDFPYHPKPVNDLSGTTDGINDCVSLIVLMDGATDEVKASITKMLTDIAVPELAKEEDDQVVERFFTGCGGGPLGQIRDKCGYQGSDASTPAMLLLDLGDSGSYYHPQEGSTEVTAENIAAFMSAFKAEKLDKKTFGQ